MKILFIDDDRDSVANAGELLNAELENPSIEFVGFDDAEKRLQDYQPDIVVLDLFQGAPPENPEGLKIKEFVWENCFCPVIVYSAAPELLEDELFENEHPLTRTVKKGAQSPEKVLSAVDDLKPVVDTL